MTLETLDKDMIVEIKQIMNVARGNVARHINNELLLAYWQRGKTIVDFEKSRQFDDKSSRQLVLALSKQLNQEFGKGFFRSNLFNMRKFFLRYPSVQSLSGQLSWSHYCELLSISDDFSRSFYEKETINSKWSVRELKRQIATRCLNDCYYQRATLIKKKYCS